MLQSKPNANEHHDAQSQRSHLTQLGFWAKKPVFKKEFILLVAEKPKILIVDDDASILHTFSRIFEKKGFTVAVAEKGEDAKEQINAHCYDVALIDFCLPDMNGTQLFPYISEASPKAVKILITGKLYLNESIEGADAFFAKPVDPAKMLSVIDTKLQKP
jgi:DNA-binding NtrC family response regulator